MCLYVCARIRVHTAVYLTALHLRLYYRLSKESTFSPITHYLCLSGATSDVMRRHEKLDVSRLENERKRVLISYQHDVQFSCSNVLSLTPQVSFSSQVSAGPGSKSHLSGRNTSSGFQRTFQFSIHNWDLDQKPSQSSPLWTE